MFTCKMTRRNDEAQVAERYVLPGADTMWGSSWGGSQQGRAALQLRSTACDHRTPCPPKWRDCSCETPRARKRNSGRVTLPRIYRG